MLLSFYYFISYVDSFAVLLLNCVSKKLMSVRLENVKIQIVTRYIYSFIVTINLKKLFAMWLCGMIIKLDIVTLNVTFKSYP